MSLFNMKYRKLICLGLPFISLLGLLYSKYSYLFSYIHTYFTLNIHKKSSQRKYIKKAEAKELRWLHNQSFTTTVIT